MTANDDVLLGLQPIIRAACSQVLGGRSPDLDDAVQQSLIKLWKHLQSYDYRLARLSTFAHLIARTVAIDVARARRPVPSLRGLEVTQPVLEPDADALDLLDSAGLSRRERRMVKLLMDDPGQTIATLQRRCRHPKRIQTLRLRNRVQVKLARLVEVEPCQ